MWDDATKVSPRGEDGETRGMKYKVPTYGKCAFIRGLKNMGGWEYVGRLQHNFVDEGRMGGWMGRV